MNPSHTRRLAAWTALLVVLIVCAPLRAELKVSTDFESGSATVLSSDSSKQTLRITPAGDPDRGWPCWWFLRVDNLDPGKPLTVEVAVDLKPGKSMVTWALPTQANFSVDGKKWDHTAKGQKHDKAMSYTIPAGPKTVWLAWGPPFTPADATALVEKIAKEHPYAKASTLCKSRGGRTIPMLQLAEGDKPAAQRPAVWVDTRQHAWESGGSWVGVGFIEWLVSDDADARWLRQNAEVFFVPLMDVDHVATGDGGKEAKPQDQNRDWSDQPYWPEVAASQKRIADLAKENRLSVFLDLHNPGPSPRKPEVYVIDPAYAGAKAAPRQERLFSLLDDALGGVSRVAEKPQNDGQKKLWMTISTVWVATHGNPDTVAFTVETPWNVPTGTTDGYKSVGEKTGHAVTKLLRDPKP